ncbi:MAG: hypothetical protein IJ816_00660 [Alloprevotella sp.]|nr:hypothetical protein [Alloprevotella sp.]
MRTFATRMEEDARNSSDIALELARLHVFRGIEFTRQLQSITMRREFRLVRGETSIYTAISETDDDFPALLSAAQRAVTHGYRVFILPNPKGIRTADFIFERKGLYRMYDLKTIQGKASIINRLAESIGQTNHVLLNMATTYNGRLLATQIKRYFELNPQASEVLIFKGGQAISVKRGYALDKLFVLSFSRKYGK